MARSISEDLANPRLFEDNTPGDYAYVRNDDGSREVSGYLAIASSPQRDLSAQLAAGSESRRGMGDEWGHDDGGHLIAARFGGSSVEENLIAQDSNFNRGAYKRMENDWASHIASGDKVFVHMETSAGERPDALMGYAIFEHPDGGRDIEYYSYLNESISQQEQWREGPDEYVDDDFVPTSAQSGQGEGFGDDMDDDMGIE